MKINRSRLKPERRLLPDLNPWKLDPLEFTMLYLVNVLGIDARKVVDSYCLNPELSDIQALWRLYTRFRSSVRASSEPRKETYGARVWFLWWHSNNRPAWRGGATHLERKADFLSEPFISVRDWATGNWNPANFSQRVEIKAAINGSHPSRQKATDWNRRNSDKTLPKTCPRDRGTMLPETDWYGSFATCVNCGYIHDSRTIAPLSLEKERSELGRPRPRHRQPSHGKIRL